MGINYQWNDNPFPAIWGKYLFIASFGLVSVFTGKTLGEILEDNEAVKKVREIMQEIHSLAKGKGIELPGDIIEDSINKVKNFAYDTKTSYQRDVETKGRQSEWDLFGGTVIRYAEKFNIPANNTKETLDKLLNILA